MPCGRCSESEGGRDEPLTWGAPYQRKDRQPGFINGIDAWRSGYARGQRRAPPGMFAPQDARRQNPAENIFAVKDRAGTSKPPPIGAAAIKALFKAVKEILSPKADEGAPQPARRRRGDTDKGFVMACRATLRRAAKRQARTPAGKAALYLSDTLDWLNLWQDNADNDRWHEDEFSATYWDSFPQP